MQLPSYDSRAALVVAHPSHELRVHGWLQLVRPHVFVLTDGSGRYDRARLAATTRVLDEIGAQPGSIYGPLTDLELYEAILSKNFDLFIGLSDKLADSLLIEQIECVVGDAAEGYSSAHDVCRLLIDAAVRMIGLKDRRHVSNLDFLVVGPPDDYAHIEDDERVWIHLSDDMFSRKITTAHNYGPELAADIDAALKGERFQGIKRFYEPPMADAETYEMILTALKSRPEIEAQVAGGVELDTFRIECLRPVRDRGTVSVEKAMPPFYEIYGETLVAAGRYNYVIRYRDHIRPLEDALREHVEKSV